MTTETVAAPIGEVRAASTAGGGTALSGTAARIVLPIGTRWVSLTPRNFSTAVVAKFNLNPWLTVLKTTDALASAANLTDYSNNAQDGSTSTDITLSSLGELLAGDALYVGASVPFGGAVADVDAANATASALAVHYWDGSAWTSITPTDGTASGGAAFAQDGSVTWTVPTDWVAGSLKDITGSAINNNLLEQSFFWTRWSVSVALDSSTTLNSLIAINRDTTYGELVSGQAFETACFVGTGGISSVTTLTDAGTANLIVNAATRGRGARFS